MHVQPSLDDEDESIKSTIITIMVGAFRAPNIPEAGRPFVASLGGAHLRTGGGWPDSPVPGKQMLVGIGAKTRDATESDQVDSGRD